MTKRKLTTNAGRLNALEAELKPKNKPTIVIRQSLDNPDLYFIDGKPGGLMPSLEAPDYQTYANGKPGDLWPKQELISKLEKDYLVIVISYEKNWRSLDQ